jgi:acylphosphatase
LNSAFHLFITGFVQGVCFRANTRERARALGLTGWVRNLADGRVEIVLEGDARSAAEMLSWCHRGTPPARVDHVECRERSPTGAFSGFDIRR